MLRITSITRSRIALLASAVGLVGGLAIGVAAAQDYPVETGTLSVVGDDAPAGDDGVVPLEPAPLATGDEVHIRGGGYVPGSEVTLTLESDPIVLVVTTADAHGEIDVIVSIPEQAEAGAHTVKASGEAAVGGQLVLELPIEVAEPGAARIAPASDDSTGNGLLIVLIVVAAAAAVGGWVFVRPRITGTQ